MLESIKHVAVNDYKKKYERPHTVVFNHSRT